MSINSVTISGNIGREPDVRTAQSGSCVLTFSVAVNDRVKQNDEWTDYTNWVDVVVFGKRASSLSKILSKGMKVCVDGKLRYSSWEKDGQRRSKLEVIAEDVDIMQRKGDGSGGSGNHSYGGGNANRAENYTSDDVYSDDIPF